MDRLPGNALVIAKIEKDAGGRRPEGQGQRIEEIGERIEDGKGQRRKMLG